MNIFSRIACAMDYLTDDYIVKDKEHIKDKRSNSVTGVRRKHSFAALTRRTFGSGSQSAQVSPHKSEPKSPYKSQDKKLKALVREERSQSKWYAYTPSPFRTEEKVASHVDIPKVI